MNKGRLAVVAVLAGLSVPVPSSGVVTKPLVASWLDAQGRVWATPGEDSPWVRIEGVDQARATATSSGLVFMVDDAGRVLHWSGGGRGARRIAGIADGRKLSCGPHHCLSLSADGSVFQWSARATEATRVAGLREVVAIAAGSDHSLAATETGQVFAWGQNDSGQLGASGAASAAPMQVEGLSEAISVGAGSKTSVALLRSGEVVVWGRNDLGQLGLNRVPVLAPTAIPHLRANSIAASADQAWLTTPVGELIELSATEKAGDKDEPESLGLYPSSRGAISLEEDGSLRLLGPTTSRVPASIFEHGFSRSLMETPAPESIRGASSAVIVIGATTPSEADQVLGARLEALGFVLSYIEDRAADPRTLQGAGLIVFAPSARGSRLSGALAGLQVPMLALDPFVSVRLGLTSSDAISSGVSSGSRTVVVNAERQIGRALGEGEFEARPHPQWMSWAQAAGADVIAVAPSGHANVFTLEEGAESSGGKTPERRAVLLLGANPDVYHASAWALFDAAARWSVRAAPAAGAGRLGGQSVFSLTGGTGTILLVVGNLSLSAEDNAYKTRMEAMGFTVETKLASASGAADATGKKLVYVSGSSPNGDILAKFLNVTVPVLIQSTGIVDDMLMTNNGNRGTDAASTQVTVQTPSHSIAVPLTGTVTVGTVAASQSWGIGSGSAQHILAPFANSGHYALFVYPPGVSMVGANAPSRRVFYSLYNATNFTTPGLDLFERMIFWATGTNVAPVVNAGPNRPAEEGISITLNGSVVDDGLPGATTIAWTKTSGPSVGTVTFGTPSAATTTATFSKTGVYTLRLTANDGAGAVYDETQITVQLPGVNAPPVVNAGADKSVLVGVATTLNGSASDDSFPVGSTLSVAWSRVSGPGAATFGTPSAVNTTLTLGAAGTHVIRLTATESGPGGLTVFDDVVITASAPVLLVVGNTTLNASDAALKARFEALGFPVTVQLGSATVANDANGKALVWASASTPNVDIGSKFLNKGIPVVIQTAGSVDDMGMTPDDSVSRGSAAGQSQATVTAPLNWLAAGLSGTLLTSNAPGNYDWGLPAAAAQKVTAMPSLPTQSTLFAYAAGATLSSGLPAAGRRLFFGYQDATTLSIAGWRLFDQAVLWLASKNGAPIANAGPDQTLAWSSPSVVASLSGVIVDDGLPSGGVLATSWAALSGPATVTFGSATAPSTTATFTAPGDYVLKLSATETVNGQPVNWTSPVGVSVIAATITKTAGTAVWDSGAISTQAIGSGDGYVEATISGTTSFWMFGLGSGNTDANYTDIEYAIFVRSDSTLQVFESGVQKFSSVSYASGDVIRVAIESGVVRYRKNGTLFYTSLLSPAGLYPLTADSSIFTNGAAITSATIGSPGLASTVLAGSDLMTVSVVDGAQNAAPVVSVGADRSVRLPASLPLNAVVGDDGLPVSPGVTSVAWSKVAGPGTATFNPSGNASTSVTFSAAGIYVLRATASDGVLSSSDDLTVVVDAAETALFVVGNALLDAGDAVAKARLEALGFSVTVTTNAVAAEATGKRVVVISSSVNAGAVSGTFTNVSVPVVVLENFVFDDMGMTGPEATHAGTATGTQTAMTGTSHPLAALMTGSPTVYNSTGDIGWGIPGGNAIKASTLISDATKATVFGYEAGTAMFTGISPARRVGLFLRPQSANSKGLAFFDAAVRWATEGRAPALLVTGNTSLTAADQALVARLSAQRLSVSVTTAAALSAPDTAGKALVVVSSTADAVALGIKLRDTAVPVLFANQAAYANAKLTGATLGVDFGTFSSSTLIMSGVTHALSVGLSGTQTILNSAETLGWGTPSSGAVSIATPNPASPAPARAIFAYEVGAMMSSLSAPDRRVAFPLGSNSAANLTTAGASLLDAAIRWALSSDRDGDGLGVFDEIVAGADPSNPDTNGDGVPDGAAVRSGLSATALDMDGDGLSNLQEQIKGTDPFSRDTDGDGSGDLVDCFPLDPLRSTCPGVTPGDVTPPVITLSTPPGASLISSVPPLD